MRSFLPLLLLMACLQASAQLPFSLDSAWAAARRHYTLLKQKEVTDPNNPFVPLIPGDRIQRIQFQIGTSF